MERGAGGGGLGLHLPMPLGQPLHFKIEVFKRIPLWYLCTYQQAPPGGKGGAGSYQSPRVVWLATLASQVDVVGPSRKQTSLSGMVLAAAKAAVT